MEALRAALRDVVLAHMATDAAHDLAHLDRVWANCQEIAAGEDAPDMRVLLAAAYLHDLVNLPKDDPQRDQASRMAAEHSAPVLTGLDFTDSEIKATQHAIATHSFSAGLEPDSAEARILRDADRLDALGAIGIARTFAVAGDLKLALYDPVDPFAELRALDDRAWALDHWPVKLFRLPEGMTTATGRVVAENRVSEMRSFAKGLAAEIGTVVPKRWR
ncbi:putative hydrolase [Shimia sp. SK013]|uniref:HD domain-containing protein n=1 Tax=Shimia sp. SK013 TaxID=1389006 RepID=UPI0006B58AF1|nr:HD domain-containing protein [Shimia sp. SK013]KPA19930.1 putative hydrolase [Shimia sp. SK013]